MSHQPNLDVLSTGPVAARIGIHHEVIFILAGAGEMYAAMFMFTKVPPGR